MIFIVTEFTSTEFGSVLCVQEVTELKDRHTATATQLPTAATGDHSGTLSELHHNDRESAPVIMYSLQLLMTCVMCWMLWMISMTG